MITVHQSYSVTTVTFIVSMWINLCRLHNHCRNAFVQVLKNTKKLSLMFVFQNVCQTLWCSVKGFCRSKLDAAADGTQCGEKKVRCQWGARLYSASQSSLSFTFLVKVGPMRHPGIKFRE